MTRRRDLMLEDILYCNHEPIMPVVDNGVIIHWICGCGKEVPIEKANPDSVSPTDKLHGDSDSEQAKTRPSS